MGLDLVSSRHILLAARRLPGCPTIIPKWTRERVEVPVSECPAIYVRKAETERRGSHFASCYQIDRPHGNDSYIIFLGQTMRPHVA